MNAGPDADHIPQVVFAFGDAGKFKTATGGTPSLDSAFTQYSAHRLKSLGHIVATIDEYCTSQRDPNTFGIASTAPDTRLRVKKLEDSGRHMHRDVLAGQGIAVKALMQLKGR